MECLQDFVSEKTIMLLPITIVNLFLILLSLIPKIQGNLISNLLNCIHKSELFFMGKLSIKEFTKILKLEMLLKLYWIWIKLNKLINHQEDVIVEEVVPHIIDRKNIIIKILKRKQIKNKQNKKLNLKDSKVLKLIKMEVKAEKL